MLSDNIEKKVREILKTQSKGGWLRTNVCANLFAKGNLSKKTKFYRWKLNIEKGKVEGFQIVHFPKNVSFIGLNSANPKTLEEIAKTEENSKNGKKQNKPTNPGARHLKWRGTPEGGGNRYFKYMFDDDE